MLKKIPADYFDSSKGTLKLLWEEEWRALGITQVDPRLLTDHGISLMRTCQSLGWEHYEVHEPEPHILLFKSVLLPKAFAARGARPANPFTDGPSIISLR